MSQSPDACTLRVGTSGYSYAEWVDAGFYPPGTQPGRMLRLYAQQFPATELNYTWYQMPKAEGLERQSRQVPPGFLFALKLTRTLTHEVEENWRAQAAEYRDSLAPLIQSRQLAAVLVQLPPQFDRAPANRRYLADLLDALPGLPLVVEFRHASWAHEKVFAELERRKVSLALVDEPNLPGLFPALDVTTNPELFYVRFHGRNARGWRSGQMNEKFDYSYSEPELREWVERRVEPLAQRSRQGLLFFNNHVRAQAPRNARTLIKLLLERGLNAKTLSD